MRETQYIGLTDAAKAYVKKQQITSESTYNMTLGLGDEVVYGQIVELASPSGPNKLMRLVEEVQDEPWSSGPMIFTHWHRFLIKESGQEIDMGYILSWVLDPDVIGREFDPVTGHYYV